MKTVTLHLPDSIQLTEQQLQKLLLQKLAETKPTLASDTEAVQVPVQDAAEIRHLMGLYYAEKASNMVDNLWKKNGWTAETMHKWLSERMRSLGRK